MMTAAIRSLLLATVLIVVCAGQAVLAQVIARSPADCAPYTDAVNGPASKLGDSASAVPDRLLTNFEVAIPCLVKVIGSLKSDVTSIEFSGAARGKFLSATGAVRTILANNAKDLSKVIETFRNNDDLDVISVLAFAVRSPDYNSRLNALLILGNVIDNTTVCVPVDHLYAPQLDKDAEFVLKGTANLLGIISVVAPWAYKETYNGIANVRTFWTRKPLVGDKYAAIRDSLQNIKARLDAQNSKEDANKKTPLPANLRACLGYAPQWAKASEWMKDPPSE